MYLRSRKVKDYEMEGKINCALVICFFFLLALHHPHFPKSREVGSTEEPEPGRSSTKHTGTDSLVMTKRSWCASHPGKMSQGQAKTKTSMMKRRRQCVFVGRLPKNPTADLSTGTLPPTQAWLVAAVSDGSREPR